MVPNVMFDQKVPVLTYAACEWFLIFLMLIDALLSYLLVWFARYCRLQMPCFLCSKILHPLHWRLLICRNHRSEVSSYMSCLNHDNKLSDCRGMCNDCLLSFTKTTGPNPDVNRLLLGKLGYDLLSTTHSTHLRSCSCCDKPWRARHHTQRLIRLGSRGRNSSANNKPNIPSAPRHHPLTRRGSVGSLKKMRVRDHNRPATSGGEYVDGGSRSDGVGYTELKIHSGSESDFLFTDDDAFLRMTDFNVDSVPENRGVRKSRSRTSSFEDKKKMSKRKETYVQEKKDKKVHAKKRSSVHEERKIEQEQTPVATGEHGAVISELITMSEARPFSLGLPQEGNAGAATQNENEIETSGNSSPSGGEFLSPGGNSAFQETQVQEHDDPADFAQNLSDSDARMEESDAAMEQKGSVHLHGSVADDEEDRDEGDFKPSLAHEQSSEEEKEEVNVADDEEDGAEGDFKPLEHEQSSEEEEKEVNENNVADEYFTNEEEEEEEEEEVNADSEPLISKDVSVSAEEQYSEKEEEEEDGSNKVEEEDNRDSEPLTSNNAAEEQSSEKEEEDGSNEVEEVDNATDSVTEEHSVKEEDGDDDHEEETEPLSSPKLSSQEPSLEHTNIDSSKVKETQSTSNEPPEMKNSASVESFASISSDIEGDSLVDLLKQQLEYDRKCLRELSKELEEERNASAIATNEAMAMITRLQEEKASLQMEALQYLRMMDEQAEHDVDALERANDVLADREKEIQDLEMELEYYRVKYPDESREEILASMGVLEGVETSGNSDTDETSEKVPIE